MAAVDQWYRQRLPSFGKGFEFQVKRNTLVQIIYFSFELECKKNEKEAGVAIFKTLAGIKYFDTVKNK